MSNFFNSDTVFLRDVILDYNDLWVAAPSMDAKKKDNPEHNRFRATVLFEETSDAYKTAAAAVKQAAVGLWGANAKNVLEAMAKNSLALRKGNQNLDKSGNVKQNYAGMRYVVASNKAAPQIIGPARHNGKFIHIGQDGQAYQEDDKGRLIVLVNPPYEIIKPYRGCRVNIKLNFCAGKADAEKNLPNQVFCQFEAVQFKENGTAFGRGSTSAEGFEDEEVVAPSAGKADGMSFDDMDDDIAF